MTDSSFYEQKQKTDLHIYGFLFQMFSSSKMSSSSFHEAPLYLLTEKIKRLEALLTKCKESIKANKQKTQALTEVKESLAVTLGEREKEYADLKATVVDYEARQAKAQEEELQIAETKMMMHQVRLSVTFFFVYLAKY